MGGGAGARKGHTPVKSTDNSLQKVTGIGIEVVIENCFP